MAATGYSAGAIIPFTQTFIQDGTTTAIPLVGQILDNGVTNFVGYDNGYADYLLTASAPNAMETTLADGSTYYISSGSPPAGYTPITGSVSMTAPSSSHTGSIHSSSAGAGVTTSSGSSSSGARMTTTPGSSSRTSSASMSATTTSSAQRLSGDAVLSLGLALLATISLLA